MDATVVIPTKNGGELLRKVLSAVNSQVTKYSFEVICVDSGSSDNTIDIIKNSGASLYQIPPESFGHGKTRNYGASLGSGEYIVFLTQDALPANENWLESFISAMRENPEVVGGFGKHLPYDNCNLFDKRDISAFFEGFGTDNTVYYI